MSGCASNRAIALLSYLLLSWVPAAWCNPVSTENVTASLVAESPAVPGEPVELLLVLDIRPGWHTYWRNPGDSGEPPRIDWDLPPGVEAGPLGFTHPERIPVGPLTNYGYSGRALHPVSLRIPADWPAGEPVEVRAQAHWLVCAEHCIPESANLALEIDTSATARQPDPAVAGLFAQARGSSPESVIDGAWLVPTETGLRLSVPAPGIPPTATEIAFFPGSWGLIEHAADQHWRFDGDRLLIDLAPGPSAGSTDPNGLLVVRVRDGGTRSFEVTVGRGPPPAGQSPAPQALGLPLALAFAFLGGLILNLMPCVFPVLAIKALSLAGQGGLDSRDRALHGISFTAGVLVFFGVLAGLLLGLRAGGANLGWGFQLQYPPFVALMAYLFLVLGLGLAGALTLGSRLMGLAGGIAGSAHSAQGTAAAFLTGALAAVVAAPCTAPFMGAALGYGMTVPWPATLGIMLMLGLGLAAPFLVLSFWPGLATRLPRPGPWMVTLKEILAFPLLATAAWLLWVLSVQVGPGGVALVLAGMLVLTFGLWARERTAMASTGWERTGRGAALLGLGIALWLGFATAPGPSQSARAASGDQGPPSEPYAPGRLAGALAEARPVFVNMTAAWCITCLVNERLALSSREVAERFRELGVLYLKGDWTNRDPEITDYLAGFGRNGVPIYVYYPSRGEPRVLPQILTSSIVTDSLGSPSETR